MICENRRVSADEYLCRYFWLTLGVIEIAFFQNAFREKQSAQSACASKHEVYLLEQVIRTSQNRDIRAGVAVLRAGAVVFVAGIVDYDATGAIIVAKVVVLSTKTHA